MNLKQNLFRRIIAAVGLVGLLAACAAPTAQPQVTPLLPTSAPTLDPATIVAAAVRTISAQMTEQAVLNPTATPTPTNTPFPTPAAPTPTTTPEAALTQQAQPTIGAAGGTVAGLSAKFLYSTTYPGNKRQYLPNETFSLAMGFENNGTVAWEPGLRLQISGFVGEITVQQDATLDRAVDPGEKVEFNLWAFGSETITTHTWYFQIVTPSGGLIPGGYGSFTYQSIAE